MATIQNAKPMPTSATAQLGAANASAALNPARGMSPVAGPQFVPSSSEPSQFDGSFTRRASAMNHATVVSTQATPSALIGISHGPSRPNPAMTGSKMVV